MNGGPEAQPAALRAARATQNALPASIALSWFSFSRTNRSKAWNSANIPCSGQWYAARRMSALLRQGQVTASTCACTFVAEARPDDVLRGAGSSMRPPDESRPLNLRLVERATDRS